ncbi:MAG TPA: polysaccharide deacetylase family protein [Stellaceae bacterium]|nr:polysaccharide deacetylase family protein [Stellaceae bacterium]
MKPHERAQYSAIVDRPKLALPAGVRLVIWPIVNLEVWEIERPMARTVLPAPTGVAVAPDLCNWSWHEYGMRVGVWRFFEAFDRIHARTTLSINAAVCERYPRVAEAARERRWEFMGHSLVQMPIHAVPDQRAMIHEALDRLETFTGARPKGWLGPGLTETYETPDLLAEAGVQYVGDWVYDDEPTVISTAHGPLVTLPYTVELNDIPLAMVQHHHGDILLKRACDQFDRLYAEGTRRAKILSIAIHPYITGVPHRIRYLEEFLAYARRHEGVQFWTGEEILDWYRAAANVAAARG